MLCVNNSLNMITGTTQLKMLMPPQKLQTCYPKACCLIMKFLTHYRIIR
jgi:hypothetical protein